MAHKTGISLLRSYKCESCFEKNVKWKAFQIFIVHKPQYILNMLFLLIWGTILCAFTYNTIIQIFESLKFLILLREQTTLSLQILLYYWTNELRICYGNY